MDIKELQDKLFDVLCVVDDICKKNNLTYFLHGGIEIGSVREKDFIPWDDDVDINIPAEDLSRFFDIMQKNLPPHIHIAMPDFCLPYFYDFTIRIYDDRYFLRTETDEDRAYKNFQNRVTVDVLLIAKAPNNFLLRKFLLLKSKILYGLAMAHRYKIDYKKYSFLQKIQVFFLTNIGKLFTTKFILSTSLNSAKKYDNSNTDWRFYSNDVIRNLLFFPNSWYQKGAFGVIRNRKFPIIKEWDKELKLRYGNYMIPEKDEKKYTKHL